MVVIGAGEITGGFVLRTIRGSLPYVVALAPVLVLIMARHADAGSSTLYLSAGGHRIRAEVAATVDARDRGLMGRRSLPAGHGMLFIFPEAHRHCMWMRNTHIPLSVAFIDDRGTVVNIEEMQPDTYDYHCAARPVRYALEMYGGWFAGKHIAEGSHIRGLDKAPPGR